MIFVCAMSMTFVCLDIAKLGMSNIIGYFFSLLNMPMHDMFKRKKYAKKNQKKKDQKCFKNDCKCVF